MEAGKFSRLSLVLALCFLISSLPENNGQDAPQRNYDDYLRGAADSFPWTEDVSGFTVVNAQSKPGFNAKELIMQRRPPFLPSEDRSYTVYRRVPFSNGMKYTEHLAYIRKFNGETNVEWDPVTSVENNPADGTLAQLFAPSLFRHAKCDHQIKPQYQAVYDQFQKNCDAADPYQNCCQNEIRRATLSRAFRLLQNSVPGAATPIREIRNTKLNVHSDNTEIHQNTKDHYNSGYKHVKNQEAEPLATPVSKREVDPFLEFLISRGKIFRVGGPPRVPGPVQVPSVPVARRASLRPSGLTPSQPFIRPRPRSGSRWRILRPCAGPSCIPEITDNSMNPDQDVPVHRQRRQLPGLGGLLGGGGGGDAPKEPPKKKEPKKSAKKPKAKDEEGSAEKDEEEAPPSKKKKTNKLDDDRKKRSLRQKRQLPMISVLSTVDSEAVPSLLNKDEAEQLGQEIAKSPGSPSSILSKSDISKYLAVISEKRRLEKKKLLLRNQGQHASKYSAIGHFYDEILNLKPDVTTVFQSDAFTTPEILRAERRKSYLSYGINPQTGNPFTEDQLTPFTGSSTTCPYEPKNLESVKNTREVAQLVDFHLSHLKAQCVWNLRDNVLNLFSSGLLKIKSGLRVSLNINHETLESRTPNRDQWNAGLSGILFYSYANAYMDTMEKMELTTVFKENMSPTGQTISWSVRTLSTLIFRALATLEHLEHHAVKITKYFASVARQRFLETLYVKLQLEKQCPGNLCKSEMEVNFNDRAQLFALMEFSIFGVDQAIQDKALSMEGAFNKFYKDNINYITDRVERLSKLA